MHFLKFEHMYNRNAQRLFRRHLGLSGGHLLFCIAPRKHAMYIELRSQMHGTWHLGSRKQLESTQYSTTMAYSRPCQACVRMADIDQSRLLVKLQAYRNRYHLVGGSTRGTASPSPHAQQLHQSCIHGWGSQAHVVQQLCLLCLRQLACTSAQQMTV